MKMIKILMISVFAIYSLNVWSYGNSNIGYTETDPITGKRSARAILYGDLWQSYTSEYELTVTCFDSGRVSIWYHTGGRSAGRNYTTFVVKIDDQEPYVYHYDRSENAYYGLRETLNALSAGNIAYIKAVQLVGETEYLSPLTTTIPLKGSAKALEHIYQCMEANLGFDGASVFPPKKLDF